MPVLMAFFLFFLSGLACFSITQSCPLRLHCHLFIYKNISTFAAAGENRFLPASILKMNAS
jgi:hypothetical protein